MGGARSVKLRVVALICAFEAVASPALAFEFGWDTPAGCPTAAFVEGEVSRIVGRPWRELGSAWRRASAAIIAEGESSFRLRLSIAFANGSASERSVTASSCTEAAEAAVAILVAGIAPQAASAAPTSAEGQTPTSAEGGTPRGTGTLGTGSDGARAEADGAVLDVSSSAPVPGDAPSGSEVSPVLNAQLGADVGSLAQVAPFAQLSAGIEVARFAFGGFIGATGRVDGEAGSSGAGARMFLLMAGASGCYAATRANPVLWGCAGMELGSLEASGFGASDGRDARAFWSAAFVRGALDWNITDATVVSVGLAAVAPFQRLRVVLSPEEVHRAAVVAVRPYAGLGVRFR